MKIRRNKATKASVYRKAYKQLGVGLTIEQKKSTEFARKVIALAEQDDK